VQGQGLCGSGSRSWCRSIVSAGAEIGARIKAGAGAPTWSLLIYLISLPYIVINSSNGSGVKLVTSVFLNDLFLKVLWHDVTLSNWPVDRPNNSHSKCHSLYS
jgi:hypothetical protein